MKGIFAYVSNQLSEQGIIKQEDIDTCMYGLEVFASSVLELLSVLVISLFLKNFVYTLIFFVSFIPLRIYAGGYHADTRLRCYLILLAVYAIFTVALKYIPVDSVIPFIQITTVFTLSMVLIFAPIVNDKKSINNAEYKFYKKVSNTIAFVEAFITLIGLIAFPVNKYLFSFSMGQLAVSTSMLAAFVKSLLKGEVKK